MSAWRRVVPLLVPASVLCAVAAFLLGSHAEAWHEFPLDDAWIHRVYARAFAYGEGFAYNPGEQVPGASSPLWVILTAPVHWLEPFWGEARVLLVKACGLACALVALGFLYAIARARELGPWSAALAASAVAADPRLAFGALSGMEGPLLVCLLAGALWAVLQKRHTWAFVLAGLAPVARPEALTLLPLFAGVAVVRRLPLRRQLVAFACLAAPTLAWAIWCKVVSDSWLPLTFHIKAARMPLEPALLGTAWATQLHHAYLGGFAILVGLAMLMREKHVALLLLAVPLIYLAGVVVSRPIDISGYYWTRYADPANLLFGFAVALGLARLLELALDARRATNMRAPLAALLLVALGGNLSVWRRALTQMQLHLWSDARIIKRYNVDAGRWLAENTPKDARIVSHDAGGIRYFSDRPLLDLAGLNNIAVARGRVAASELIAGADFVAVYPAFFALPPAFRERWHAITPLAEYTICDCPGQQYFAIFARR